MFYCHMLQDSHHISGSLQCPNECLYVYQGLPVANVVTPTVVGPDVPALFTALTAIE